MPMRRNINNYQRYYNKILNNTLSACIVLNNKAKTNTAITINLRLTLLDITNNERRYSISTRLGNVYFYEW